MAIELSCPACQQKYRLKESLAGKKAKCAKCGQSIQIPELAPAAAEPASDLSDLLDDHLPVATESAASPASTTTDYCPKCGDALARNATVCVSCGYNKKTGTKLKTSRKPTQSHSRSGSATLLRGTIFSFGGALIGAVAWVVIAIFTGYEIGWIAWGLGALAGLGMAVGHEDQDGTMAGIIAAAMAVVGILAAKGMIYDQLYRELAELGITADQIAELEAVMGESISFSAMFGPIDGLFILLAVGSAYGIGSGQTTG